MGSDVAIREDVQPQQTVRLSTDQLQYIANTEFVPKGMRGKLPQILACIAMGRELGLGDMVALNTIHVIDGRASLSAEAMVSLVRKRGHSIVGNFSGDSCTVTGVRVDNGDEMTVTWTKEMAQEAGLLSKDNYKKWRASMLWARAVSQLARMLFADCFAGSTYTPGEVPADEISSSESLHAGLDSDAVGEPLAEVTRATTAESTVTEASASTDEHPSPTAPQLKKLNVLVGTLREQGHITTEQLWTSLRPEQTDLWPGDWPRDENGVLHWSPLRDSLTKQEASDLIERLQKFADNLEVAA